MAPTVFDRFTDARYQRTLHEVRQEQRVNEASRRGPAPQSSDGKTVMSRRILVIVSAVVLTSLMALGTGIVVTAQDATPTPIDHPLVGTWIVDTVSAAANDSPEVAVVTADGGVIGLGANRVAGGRWEAIDDYSAELTLVTVFEAEGVGRYVIVRGPHTVDATGDAWTCACTFTVVDANGTVLDSGSAPANARRLPVQGMDLGGEALREVPVWQPVATTPTP